MNLLVSAPALVLACLAFLAYDVATFRQDLLRTLSAQARIVGLNSISAVVFNDAQSAENTLSALRSSPNIISATIQTVDGRTFASFARNPKDAQVELPPLPNGQNEAHWFRSDEVLLASSVVLDGKRTGTVYIRSDLKEMNRRVVQYTGIAGIVLGLSLIAALLVSAAFRRSVARPVVELAKVAQVVSQDKNYSIRAPLNGDRDEIGVLIESFNEMLAQIQSKDAALQQARDELEVRVEQRTRELADINKELEAFTYSVSHDLRAPLRRIDGFSKILLEEAGSKLDDECQRYLLRIREGTQHMGRLVDDLLNLARVGRQEPSLQLTGLNSVVERVIGDLKPEIQDRRVKFQIGRLPFVECDPALMRQVFINLVSNAVKYTRPRDEAVIEVGQAAVDGGQAIYVRDNGVGFSMKYADKLFGVFQRLHRQEDFEGTGVGLATVQRIVLKHGGRVWAEAELDKGATFYFTLAAPERGTSKAASSASERN